MSACNLIIKPQKTGFYKITDSIYNVTTWWGCVYKMDPLWINFKKLLQLVVFWL